MKKEKQVRSYQRRTKSGKMVTVRAHTAKYDATEEAKEAAAKKKGAGDEFEERKKKITEPFNEDDFSDEKVSAFMDRMYGAKLLKSGYFELKKGPSGKTHRMSMDKAKERLKDYHSTLREYAKTPDERFSKAHLSAAKKLGYLPSDLADYDKRTTKVSDKSTSKSKSGSSGDKVMDRAKTTSASASTPAFTAAEFKEWYRGTGSAADKKVAKALRAQLGREGYRKLEDEAIDNYSSRGHLSMFKRVSSTSASKTSTNGTELNAERDSKKKESTRDMSKQFASLLDGVTGNTASTYRKPAKFINKKDGTIVASVSGKISENLKKNGWEQVDKFNVAGGGRNYISKDGKYHAFYTDSLNLNNKLIIRRIKDGEDKSKIGHGNVDYYDSSAATPEYAKTPKNGSVKKTVASVKESKAVDKPTTKKFNAGKAMDEIFGSKDMYGAAKKYLGKAAVDRIYKSVGLSRPSSSGEYKDRLLSQIEENISELAWQNSQKK